MQVRAQVVNPELLCHGFPWAGLPVEEKGRSPSTLARGDARGQAQQTYARLACSSNSRRMVSPAPPSNSTMSATPPRAYTSATLVTTAKSKWLAPPRAFSSTSCDEASLHLPRCRATPGSCSNAGHALSTNRRRIMFHPELLLLRAIKLVMLGQIVMRCRILHSCRCCFYNWPR